MVFREVEYEGKSYFIVTTQSPLAFFRLVSMSILAPVLSRMVLTLHPPRPITRLIKDAGIKIFLAFDCGILEKLK